MSQWGKIASFANQRTKIGVVPHIATASAFAKITAQSRIDSLHLLSIYRGASVDAYELLGAITAEYKGKLYADWPRGDDERSP